MSDLGIALNFWRNRIWQIHSKSGWKPIIERRFNQRITWFKRLEGSLKLFGVPVGYGPVASNDG